MWPAHALPRLPVLHSCFVIFGSSGGAVIRRVLCHAEITCSLCLIEATPTASCGGAIGRLTGVCHLHTLIFMSCREVTPTPQWHAGNTGTQASKWEFGRVESAKTRSRYQALTRNHRFSGAKAKLKPTPELALTLSARTWAELARCVANSRMNYASGHLLPS